jgi:hypothetical protein
MKHFLFLLIILTATAANSQNYIKTLEENKKWTLIEHIGMGVIHNPVYHVSCDTVMNGYHYYKLWNNHNCKGYLREDTIAQQIYFITTNFYPEVLTVDYSLSPGDTFHFTYDFDPSSPNRTILDTVSHLDTILIDQIPHKRVHFKHMGSVIGGPNLFFTEGRGDRFSGVAHIHPVLTNQTGLGHVDPDTTVTCGLLSSIDDLETSLDVVNIYPNPVQNSLNIYINTEKSVNGYFLKISNLSGQVVYTKEVNSTLDNISTQDFNKGVYFVTIFDENKMIAVRKFIKN